MSDSIKHECAVALLRLRKPLEYYLRKYGNAGYGFSKMSLLLEKQHNRGQDGAGIASLSLSPEPGEPAYHIEKSASAENPLADLLGRCAGLREFGGELLLGHLRYATYGRHNIAACHPFVHESSCLRRTLLMAGNFNLTNTYELFERFLSQGHHPASKADGYLMMQTIAHYLGKDCDTSTTTHTHWPQILREALGGVDGAFTLCGINGEGDAFVIRDSHAIRPGYYFCNDEVFVAASERPAIQAAFDCSTEEVKEIPAGKAIIVSKNGEMQICDCLAPASRRSCVFERIYFSRPNDADIHRERKLLGKSLVQPLLQLTNSDWDNTFFSYIPNSAQVSFHGMLEELCHIAIHAGKSVRFGQVAIKDAKFRTFIADEDIRKELYMHVYDVTYGLVQETDTLVVLDDSIVRGSTMRNAILPILDRLKAKRIIVVSSAPPIKYPDCYGIDMSVAGDLVAFQAVVSCLKKQGKTELIQQAYEHAKLCLKHGEPTNCMKELYDAVSETELVQEIAALLSPAELRAELSVLYQSVEDLHECCPQHSGDWYFTGDYPTPGGYRMVNQALVNYLENNRERAY